MALLVTLLPSPTEAQSEFVTAAASAFAAIVSLMAALAATSLSWINLRRERLAQKISFLRVQDEYFEEMKKWADSLSDTLSEAIHICELDPARMLPDAFFNRRHELRINISSYIDRGRWFFPNYDAYDETGEATGRRGYRHEVLDSIVYSYDLVKSINYISQDSNDIVKESLVKEKKKFVKNIQIILNPARRRKEFALLTRQVHATS